MFLCFLSALGRSGFLWPGLNAPVLKQGAVQTIDQRDKEEQEKVQAEKLRLREEFDRKRKIKVKRERGWTGRSWGGISLGPPDPSPTGGKITRCILVVLFVHFIKLILCMSV